MVKISANRMVLNRIAVCRTFVQVDTQRLRGKLMRRLEELCGVIVYCYPPVTSFGRRLVLPKMSMKELNEKLSVVSRVVVHPKYRTIGLGTKLIKDTLPLAGTEYVEMSAVMAKYNPFAEKAGMKRIAEQAPPKEATRIVGLLCELVFNEQLLGSEKYVLEKLQSLDGQDVERIRQAFARYGHPRFMKAFSYHLPFGMKQAYRNEIENLTLEKLANLIKICGFLMQTKVYLFLGRMARNMTIMCLLRRLKELEWQSKTKTVKFTEQDINSTVF